MSLKIVQEGLSKNQALLRVGGGEGGTWGAFSYLYTIFVNRLSGNF